MTPDQLFALGAGAGAALSLGIVAVFRPDLLAEWVRSWRGGR